MNRSWQKWIGVFIIVSIIGGCRLMNEPSSSNTKESTSPAVTKVTLLIAAASDLSLAFREIGEQFERETNSQVEFSFGSTGTLAQQIENGAPFDIFAAANVSFVDNLNAKGLVIADTQQLYAQGRIGMAIPLNSSLHLTELKDLLDPSIKKVAIANPEHAPYGLAAKQALEKAGVWEQIQSKLVYGKNISEALTFITTGNAEAGIIAQSIANQEVSFSRIDPELHEPINQAIAVIQGTKHEELARQFVHYVNGTEGRTIMLNYGFVPPLDKVNP